MTTKNIKTDYGAVGDGQIATAVLTVSGTTLTSTTALWANSDVGKLIAIEKAGAGGVAAFMTTISGFTNAQVITLTDTPTSAFTSQTRQVEWGTDDNTAFTNFHNDFQGASGVFLTIPPGRYCFCGATTVNGGPSNSNLFSIGVTELTVTGDVTTPPTLTDMLGAGNGLFMGPAGAAFTDTGDGSTGAKTQTSNIGDTTLTLITHTDISLFTANTWAVMTGFDIQGFGFPANLQFFEFVFITAVHNGAGGVDPSTVTLQSGLKNRYSSAWPLFFGQPAGPAKLFQMHQNWAATHTYNNLVVVSTPTLTNLIGQNVNVNNVTCPVFGLNPTQTQNATFTNYSVPNIAWELDKIIENITLNNCTLHQLSGANSSSPNVLTMNSTTISAGPNIGAKTIIANGCTLSGGLHIGPGSYGVATGSATFTSCVIDSLDTFGGVAETDLAGTGAYTMSGGVISRVKSAGTGAPPQWAVPGGWCYFGGYRAASSAFQVLDVTDDGTNIHIQTNLAGGFPAQFTNGGSSTPIKAQTCPSTKFSFVGCTGSDVAVGLSGSVPAKRPYCSYWNFTYQGVAWKSTQAIIPLWGKVVSIVINVSTAFTGTGALSMNFGPPFVLDSTNHVVQWTGFAVDLKTAGTRTITPSGVTGTAGLDSGLTLPDATTWMVGDQFQPTLSADISGQSVGLYPVVTITIITDQGIPLPSASVNRLRFRLKA
jgi:hypothetical protein